DGEQRHIVVVGLRELLAGIGLRLLGPGGQRLLGPEAALAVAEIAPGPGADEQDRADAKRGDAGRAQEGIATLAGEIAADEARLAEHHLLQEPGEKEAPIAAGRRQR